ncbi:CynX/NimT family MFS transporter [Chloroflexota bacterium]
MVKSRVNLRGELPSPYNDGEDSTQKRYRWVMLALVWLLYFVFGVFLRSIAPLVTPILRDLNISYSQMGIIFGAWPLTYIVVAMIGGTIIDRWGIRKSLLLGTLIMGLSEGLRYFASGLVTMFLFVALLGLGGPMISIGCPKTISIWFKGKERGLAVGIYSTAPWIGVIIAYSLTNSVIMPLTGYSWRLTFVCYALLAFAAALLWWLLARDIKPAEAVESSSMVKVFTDLIRIRDVQLILLIGFLSFAIIHGFDNWLPKILETNGLSPASAGFVSSIHLIAAIPAILVIPRLVAPRLRGRVMALMSLVTAAAILIVVMAPDNLFIIGLLLYGPSAFPISAIVMLILMEIPEVGSRYMGSAAGMFFCVAEIGGFAGPYIAGAIRDMTGNFLAVAFFIAGLSVIRVIMALALRTQHASDSDLYNEF